MSISSASKKKLAIWAVALALGGGTLIASAQACHVGEGYGYRGSTAAAGYGFRSYGWRGAGWRGAGWGWRGGGVGWRRGGVGWRGGVGRVGWRGGYRRWR